jgi:hypothetical protein
MAISVFGIDIGPFWIGVIGSIAVELVAVAAIFEAGTTFPPKYRNPWFYLIRALIAAAGGILVLIYNVGNLPAALQIGASTPAVLAALATVRRPQGGGGDGS